MWTENGPKAPRPKWLKWSLAGAGTAIAIVLAIAAAFIFLGTGQAGEETAEFLPSNTLFYASVNLQPGIGQNRKAAEVRDIIRAAELGDAQDDILDDIEDETDIHPLDDVLPWLGDHVSIAILDADGEYVEWILMAQVKDQEQVEEFVDDLLEYTEEEFGAMWDKDRIYDGEIWVEETKPIAIATTGKYLMLADSQDTVEDIIANLKSPPSRPLSMAQDFEEAQNSLPKDKTIFVFARPDAMASAFHIETELYLEFGGAAGWTEKNAPKYTSGALTFVDKGIRFDMVAPVTGKTHQVEPQAVMAAARVLPEDTLAMASTAGVADVWDTWLDWLEETEQGTAQEVNQFLDEIEGETGVDLMDDVIEELTGGIAVALLPSTIRFSPAREEFRGCLEALIVAETDDARGIEDASDALADFLEDQGYNTDQDWIGDDKLTTVDLEQFDESLSRHEANALFTEKWIALGTTRESVMEIHDTLNGETPPLASSERFSQLAELMPDPLQYVTYVDIAGILDTLSDGFNIDPSGYWLETERPLIGNLDSLILN